MAFLRYNARIKLSGYTHTTLGTSVVLPMDKMEVKPTPYVREGGTVITLYDGERVFAAPTYGYTIELSWANLAQHFVTYKGAIDYLTAAAAAKVPVTISLEQTNRGLPAIFSDSRVLTDVIPDLKAETITVAFEKRFRDKKGQLTLVTRSQKLPLYDWIATA